MFFALLLCKKSYSQTYVTWNGTNNNFIDNVSGTAGDVDVTGTLTAGSQTYFGFISPAEVQAGLIVTGSNTFSTWGPMNDSPSRDLVFNFSKPVIVTRYNMVDIDRGFNGWNDSFNFLDINFSNNPAPFSVNCIANLNGAIAIGEFGGNTENASWFCSNPVTSFTIDYQTINGLTHAYLGYSMQILEVPTLDPICSNSLAPEFPIVGNGIVGTWSPSVINTNLVGDTVYTFTPAEGQPIQCPINMTVTVNDCCLPTLLSSTTIPNPIQIERSNWISSSDQITFSNSGIGNEMVYHAGNFIDLTPGFESLTGSQFAAYPQGCSGNYSYKNLAPIHINTKTEIEKQKITNRPSFFKISVQQDEEIVNVLMLNVESQGLKIYSLDGKMIYENFSNESESYKVDIGNFSAGVYIASVILKDGSVSSEKFIKN